MRLYACPHCSARLFFRNTHCTCGGAVFFDPETDGFVAEARPCTNRAEIACPWIAAGSLGYCHACAMTDTIPDTFHGENLEHWTEAEHAKRWVLAGLARWGWLTSADRGPRPVFHLLAEETRLGDAPVTMGHASGLITINVTEADPVERVQRREALDERLRTMVGHFRHEIAHFVFERLAARPGFVDRFTALFGDPRADYGAALTRHYRDGPPEDWDRRFITKYASMHPHEDWAETAAHVMHLTDLLDSAVASDLEGFGAPDPGYDAYADRDARQVISRASALAIAVNHVNRAMGLPDTYPFVLNGAAREKLEVAHGWLRAGPP